MTAIIVPDAKPLQLEDREMVGRFLALAPHELSPYHFINIFIWRALFTISWRIIDDCLCVFFSDAHGCFMYLPPLGKKVQEKTIAECFELMDSANRRTGMSRIENVEAVRAQWYRSLGYAVREKAPDYICRQKDLAALAGDAYKSKRSTYNFFVRRYNYEYREYQPSDAAACSRLCRNWQQERSVAGSDDLYRYMLEDNVRVQDELLRFSSELAPEGRVVLVDSVIAGYTFGFSLRPDMFCIAFEVCLKAYKGLAQFIFREFCRELTGYASINIMDDSGLENLEKVKKSYRPVQQIPNFVVSRT
jgi:Uncharacterized conserved protein